MTTVRPFRDRREAGEVLARDLARYGSPAALVLGLARGGVPVGREVADHLRVPLEVCLVRKLGAPQWPELAMGAVASGGAVMLNDDVLAGLGLTDSQVDDVVERETAELHRRERAYRGECAPLELAGRTALVTARSAPAHERVIRTLREWDVRLDEALFLGGRDKGPFLHAFGADIFFDDSLHNIDSARQYIAAGHVPHGVANP